MVIITKLFFQNILSVMYFILKKSFYFLSVISTRNNETDIGTQLFDILIFLMY